MKKILVILIILFACLGMYCEEYLDLNFFIEPKFDPVEVIETTINGLIDDGQLDDVVMRLGDLKKIKEALARELEGTYQKRVDYDEAKKEKEKDEE